MYGVRLSLSATKRPYRNIPRTKSQHTCVMYGAAPVKWIYFVADRSLTESAQRQSPTPPLGGTTDVGGSGTAAIVTLGLTEGRPVPIRCLSQGGHPAPRLTVYLDRVDITDRFEASHVTDVTGPRGLRTVHYRSVRPSDTRDRRTDDRVHYRSSCWTDEFMTSSEDDGRSLRCVASVADVDVASANVTLVVRCMRPCSFSTNTQNNTYC